MDTLSLCRFACGDANIRRSFGGVFASDNISENVGKFSSFIVNLDSKNLPGSHWVAIFFRNDVAFYFDSYGYPPINKSILRFLKKNSKAIRFNPFCFQDDSSTSCGYFCLYFLHRFSRHLPLSDLHERNKKQNETFIKRFANQNLKPSTCYHDHHGNEQSCRALLNMLQHSDKT